MHSIQQYRQNNFEIIELKNETCSAKVAVNIGNTLFSLQYQQQEILYFPFSLEEYKNNTKLAGNPFMHPWANRLEDEYIQIENKKHSFPKQHLNLLYRDGNNLPLHGLLLKTDKWETIGLHEEEGLCYHVAELIFNDADWLSIFPFKHKIQINHQLQGNELKIETIIINHDENEMPISFGFHPYFLRKSTAADITIPAENTIAVDNKVIPTGNVIAKEKKWNFVNDKISLQTISFDDGFQNLKLNENKQAVFSLRQPELVESVEVRFDQNYLFAQIYAPQNPEKPYICIEPMTAITNALNTNRCKKIKTNERFTASFFIK